jgi:predicted permease
MRGSPTLLETLGIPILRGRGLEMQDTLPNAAPVALLNETAARLYLTAEPLGRRLGFSPEQNGQLEVVGILKDTKYDSVREDVPPTIYLPIPRGTPGGGNFIVRTAGDATAAIPQIREAVRQSDPNLPLSQITTQEEQLENRFRQEKIFAAAYAAFGAVALVLAAIGLFGLMSYSVARRTNEIGIRMALGAQQADVVKMVFVEVLTMVVTGVAIGITVTFAAGRMITTLLYGLAPTDAMTLVIAAAAMSAVAAIAGYLPARRASRVDPMVALHYE